jgi:hypothetical protein
VVVVVGVVVACVVVVVVGVELQALPSTRLDIRATVINIKNHFLLIT